MRLALTSDIHTDTNGPEMIEALCARARELSPDALLIAGDIATSPETWLRTILALRACAPRLLVVAGNHDVWTTPEAAAKGLDSWARLDRLLPALAQEAGADLLDAGPVVIGGVGFVGSLGWYDLSTREHLLDAPEECYETGIFGHLRWVDCARAIWPDPADPARRMRAPEVAAALLDRLDRHLRAVAAPRLVVATHTLAFHDQIHRKDHPGWRFINAFMGCLPMGERIRRDPRVVLHIGGHTHLHSDLRISGPGGGLRAIVSPVGYRREWLGATPGEAARRSMRLVEV